MASLKPLRILMTSILIALILLLDSVDSKTLSDLDREKIAVTEEPIQETLERNGTLRTDPSNKEGSRTYVYSPLCVVPITLVVVIIVRRQRNQVESEPENNCSGGQRQEEPDNWSMNSSNHGSDGAQTVWTVTTVDDTGTRRTDNFMADSVMSFDIGLTFSRSMYLPSGPARQEEKDESPPPFDEIPPPSYDELFKAKQ